MASRKSKRKGSDPSTPLRPHDALVKKIFSDPDNARLELQAVLPPELVKVIDWATLEVLPPSFIDGAFVETQADLLFRVEIAGRDARLYVVFEHKSDAKARALVQVGGYVMDVLDQYFERGGKLPAPVVIPVILHHSETGWTVARSFHELFDEALLELPAVREHVPAFQVVVGAALGCS